MQSAQNAEKNAVKAADEVAGVKTDIYDNLMPEMRQIKDDTAVLKDDTENIKNNTSDIRDDAELVKNATVEIRKQCEALAEKCENATAGIDGGLIPCGTKNFDELPELSEVKQGWMYNVADDFMTTEDFICGADFYYPAGTNIYAIIYEDGLKWDCLGGEMSGYVMKKDFSEMTANSAPEFEEAESLGLTSGISTIKTLFGNVKKLIKILGSTDISTLGDGTVTGSLSNINSVKASQTDVDSLKSGLANFSFRNNSGKAQYSMNGSSWLNFRNPVGTAVAADVLAGKTFANSSSDSIAGTMTNRGTWTSSPTASGKVTVPAGYHNGNGYVNTSGVYTTGYNAGKASATINLAKVSANTITVGSSSTYTPPDFVNGVTVSVANGYVTCIISKTGDSDGDPYDLTYTSALKYN